MSYSAKIAYAVEIKHYLNRLEEGASSALSAAKTHVARERQCLESAARINKEYGKGLTEEQTEFYTSNIEDAEARLQATNDAINALKKLLNEKLMSD